MKRVAPIIASILAVLCVVLIVMLVLTTRPDSVAETLTLDDVVELSGRGLSLSWGDFEEFEREESRTGPLAVWEFPIAEPGFSLVIDGNSTNAPPANILLLSAAGDSVEIRTGDVAAFIAQHSNDTPGTQPAPPTAPAPPPVAPTPPAPPAPAPIPPAVPGPEPIATFTVAANPSTLDVSAAYVAVTITNTSQVEGSFGLNYRIDRNVNGRWEPVPLDFAVASIAMILPAGQSTTESFSLHQNQFYYQPGTYRIVFLDGLGGASAQFTLTASPTYLVSVHPQSIPVTAEYVTVTITNTSQVEGGYGYGHRIERFVNGSWQTVPLDMGAVISIWMMLSPGQSATYDFSLHQEQYDHQPGRHRIVLTGLAG